MHLRYLALGVVGALSGCASIMSGLGGSERYACKAPEGVACTSVSGAYANSAGNVATPAPLPAASPPSKALYPAVAVASQASTTSTRSTPLRSNPRLLRVWIAPWEDADGDLHEESIVHVVVDTGRWLIEHVRPAPQSRIDGVMPPPAAAEPARAGAQTDAAPPARLPMTPGTDAPRIDPTPIER